MEKEPKGRDKAREFLKKQGKDPEKFLPTKSPESQNAGTDSSSEIKKVVDGETVKKEQLEAQAANEEKRLLETKEEELTPEEKVKRKELLALKQTEKEAKRDAGIQKRIDELVGEIKTLREEKSQDKETLSKLETALQELRTSKEKNPEKIKQEVTRLEKERIGKYLEEDKSLPREQRREMSKEELDDWLVEDLAAAQEWIADRQLRRRDERTSDIQRMEKGEGAEEARSRAEVVVRKQKESQARVVARHPELNISSRLAELRAAGKTPSEAQSIIFAENKKVKIVADILKEDGDKYVLAENGPELLAAEMERRLGSAKSETQEERETRIAEEAAEAERHRQASADSGLTPRGKGGEAASSLQSEFEKENPAMYKKHLDIWRKNFPKISESELRSRLEKRLKERRSIGAL